MVYHQVWFQLKEGTAPAVVQEMLAALRALPAAIEGIERLGCGEDFSGRSCGFQIGLAVCFRSREALLAYGPHPVHEDFVQRFKQHWDEVRALDFED